MGPLFCFLFGLCLLVRQVFVSLLANPSEQMPMSHFETPLERELALDAYVHSLGLANAAVEKTKATYDEAKRRRDALAMLIERTKSDDGAEPVPTPPKPREVLTLTPMSILGPLRKGELPSDLFDLLVNGKFIETTGDITAAIRVARNKNDLPKSSVAGALAKLAEAGYLHRVRNLQPGTSHWGLPQWFDGDAPKPEYLKTNG